MSEKISFLKYNQSLGTCFILGISYNLFPLYKLSNVLPIMLLLGQAIK